MIKAKHTKAQWAELQRYQLLLSSEGKTLRPLHWPEIKLEEKCSKEWWVLSFISRFIIYHLLYVSFISRCRWLKKVKVTVLLQSTQRYLRPGQQALKHKPLYRRNKVIKIFWMQVSVDRQLQVFRWALCSHIQIWWGSSGYKNIWSQHQSMKLEKERFAMCSLLHMVTWI